MHHIALIVMVFFIRTAGAEKPPEAHLLFAPDATIEDCRTEGARLVGKLRLVDGVADAEFDCVDIVEKAAL